MDDNTQELFGNAEPKPLFGGEAQAQPKPLFENTANTPQPLFGSQPEAIVRTNLPEQGPVAEIPQPEPPPHPVPEAAEFPPPPEETTFIPAENAPDIQEPIRVETPLEKEPVNEFGLPPQPVTAPPVISEAPSPEPAYAPAAPQMQKPQESTFTIPAEGASLGSLMRNARSVSGYELEEVFKITRIPVKYLQSIENDDFAHLPTGSFPRAYIRKLSSFYRLDSKSLEIVNAKLNELPAHEELSRELLLSVDKTKRVNEAEEKRVRKLFWIAASVAILFVFLICSGITALIISAHRSSHAEPGTVPVAEQAVLDFSRSDLEKLSAPQIPVMTELAIPSKR